MATASTTPLAACSAVLLLAACGHSGPQSAAPHAAAAHAQSAAAAGAPAAVAGCFLDARLRGALEADLAWHAPAVQCEGGARPQARGLRAVFAGRGPAGEALRIVFGLDAAPGAPVSRNVPARMTLLVEGGGRGWATSDDGQCTIERLDQQPVAGEPGAWSLRARGWCIDPARALAGEGVVRVDRFDFEGRARFEEDELHANANR